jgi:hypothetical protein
MSLQGWVSALQDPISRIDLKLAARVCIFQSGVQKGCNERILTARQMLGENIGRFTPFVQEFLKFTRGKAPNVQPVDTNRIATDVIELFKVKAAMAGVTPGLVMRRKSGHKLLYELRKEPALSEIPVLIVAAHAKDAMG